MNNVLVIGAGRSATACIDYLLSKSEENNWFVTVADANPELADSKIKEHPRGRGIWLDVTKPNDRRDILSRADLVVSLLPAHLHLMVAQDCIKLKKHLITASYVSHEMYRLGDEARDASLIFMGEMGLDPGIDHMSAMEKIHEIKKKGGQITAFRSYTGGLIAPESDDNPWHYKFTWNPRNVVLAGQGTAQYLENGKYRYLPYSRLFKSYEKINIPNAGDFEAYPNRDSLLYLKVYGLEDIPNIKRATVRNVGFCDAWAALIKIGLTDGSYPIHNCNKLSYHEWTDAYIPKGPGSLKDRTADFLGEKVDSPVMKKLEWLGIFRKKRITIDQATPALILENLLLEKWQLKQGDKDMIVMQHEFEYNLGGKKHLLTSSMVMKGEDEINTAMTKLVGLPLGIFARLIMQGKIKTTGVNIPVMKEVYAPVLRELDEYGVSFVEHEKIIG